MNQGIDFQAIVMAAGKGTRLHSERPKVLHEVLGLPMIGWAVQASLGAGAKRVVVVLGHGREQVEAWLRAHFHDSDAAERIHVAVQHEQLGTAHAVYAAREFFADAPEYSAIVSGDVPNMDASTLADFIQRTAHSGLPLGLMSAILPDPARYGRVLRGADDQVTGIVEYKDASDAQRQIQEINAGFYAVKTRFLAEQLPELCTGVPKNAQGEYYLTDLIEIAARQGGVFGSIVADNATIQGVNTRADLARAAHFARQRINQRWMDAGVTFLDPEATYVEPGVELSPDVVLYPGVHLRGRTRIGTGTIVENGAVICDTHLGPDVHIKPYCHLEDARVDAHSAIGPFAHLRPGADIGQHCKVGNFVEIKKTRMDDAAKASHLTYLGDAHVGAAANIGAGTITCNYDGTHKNHTEIGPGAFIGSNTALVAPVTLGKNAYVGAGSTITHDIPDESLAIARARQKNLDDWVRQRKNPPEK